MAYTTVFQDIVFVEGNNPNATILGDVHIDLGYQFGAQLKNLNDVKKEIASQVTSKGGNCIIDFKYGQKSRLFAIDDVSFWGSGKIASLPQDIYEEILAKKKKR